MLWDGSRSGFPSFYFLLRPPATAHTPNQLPLHWAKAQGISLGDSGEAAEFEFPGHISCPLALIHAHHFLELAPFPHPDSGKGNSFQNQRNKSTNGI